MKLRKILIIFFLIFLFLGIILIGSGYYILFTPFVKTTTDHNNSIIIEKEDKMDDVIAKIDALGIHKKSSILKPIMLLKKYDKNIRPGHYTLENKMNNNTLVNRLRGGMQTPIKFSFNNIRTIEEFSSHVGKRFQMDSLEILSLLKDYDFVNKYGFNSENILGMFIPNTYEIYYTVSVEKFFERMKREYDIFWNNSRLKKLDIINLTKKEVSILASIVEEETNKDDEKATIAGVYLNRLKKGIRLQADPTLKFALNDMTIKRILNKHKNIESPYNTYLYAGLPPGLIRQPSISGIDAVLNAEKHDYIYFCAKDDFSGYHVFARTLTQHNRNAVKYQKALNELGIYR